MDGVKINELDGAKLFKSYIIVDSKRLVHISVSCKLMRFTKLHKG